MTSSAKHVELEMYSNHNTFQSTDKGCFTALFIKLWLTEAEGRIYAFGLDNELSLSEPMLDYCKLDPWEHITVKS